MRRQTVRLQMSDGIETVDFSVIGEEQHGGVGFLDSARNDKDKRDLTGMETIRRETERGRFEEKDLRGETVRRQTIRLAERLVMFHPLTAGCMVAGDFSTSLRCARNDRGRRGLRKEV